MKLAPLLGVVGLVLASTAATADTPPTRAELVRIQKELGEHIVEAGATFGRYATAAQQVTGLYARLDEKATALRNAGAACANGCSREDGKALMAAVKDMEQAQMHFTKDYLQLQSQLQNENKQFLAVSRMMQAKHDTVKNSISNVR